MSTKFADYILKLGQDPAEAEKFEKDPAASMSAAGLTEAEQKVLTSGDQKQITTHIVSTLNKAKIGVGAASYTVVVEIHIPITIGKLAMK